MKILVLNAGSSTLKFYLIDFKNKRILAKGKCEELGMENSALIFDGKEIKTEIKNYKDALEIIFKKLLETTLKNLEEISAIGHRVVHGGPYFKRAALVNEQVIGKIREFIPLAPLHNEANLAGILACQEIFGEKIPQIVVFDTAFYFSIPEYASMYAIPYKYYEKYGIKKYGFHGTSHKYLGEKCSSYINKKNHKIITCHLGSGSSITAIQDGKAIETSMGFTPLGGFMMSTRSGSLDPSVVTFLAEKEKLNPKKIEEILNKKSGLLGISGISADTRIITRERFLNNNFRAKLAQEMFEYQIFKYISSYIGVLGGCDAIVFSGGMGENHWPHREEICKKLKFFGVEIDKILNEKTVLEKEGKISLKSSKIDIFVIPSNEELAIASEVFNTLTDFIC